MKKDPAVSCKLHGTYQGLAEQHKPTELKSNLCWRISNPSSAEGTHETRTCCSGFIYSQHENLKGWVLHNISEAACSTA